MIEKEYLYQWDINQKIKVKDETIKEIHYCNRTSNCSLVVAVVDGVADVPNILLQDSRPIRVYGYDGESTKHEALLKVVARSKPADYVYTETEVKRYEDLEKRIEAIEKSGGSGGSVDLNNYYTKAETDTAISDALANAGGGSGGGKEWRKIRTVTIPEDITTDTSGVAFTKSPTNGGYTFAFDTDEDGNPFSFTELLYVFTTGYGDAEPNSAQCAQIANSPIPLASSDQKNYRIYMYFNKSTTSYQGWGLMRLISNRYISYGNYGLGNYNNNMQAHQWARELKSGDEIFTAIALNIMGGAAGFRVGSTFEFYGR